MGRPVPLGVAACMMGRPVPLGVAACTQETSLCETEGLACEFRARRKKATCCRSRGRACRRHFEDQWGRHLGGWVGGQVL
eukprot:357178-Chlamydomonas_euryale.AAC.1